jgi:hypothetical protein
VCTVTCVLIAFRALPLSLAVDRNSPTYLVVELHPELAGNHEAVFLILSAFLLASVVMNILPIKQALPRVLFLFAFSYCAARTLLGFGFPLALNQDSPHHGTLQLPWLYCYSLAFTASSSAIHSYSNAKPKSSAKGDSSFGTVMFLICACLPFGSLVWVMISGTYRVNSHGIFWAAAVTNAILTVCNRLSELSREIKMRGSAGLDKRNAAAMSSVASSAAQCIIASSLSIFWTVIASLSTDAVSSDVTVPLSCLTLMCVNRNLRLTETHPVALAGVAAATWWLVSALYSIFVRGYASSIGLHHFELNVGIYNAEKVSIWTADGWWYPVLNFVLLLLPLPAIVLGYLRRKGESEDILFTLAIMSSLAVVASSCASVQLLGVAGVLFGAWRCYDVGVKQADSNRLI